MAGLFLLSTAGILGLGASSRSSSRQKAKARARRSLLDRRRDRVTNRDIARRRQRQRGIDDKRQGRRSLIRSGGNKSRETARNTRTRLGSGLSRLGLL